MLLSLQQNRLTQIKRKISYNGTIYKVMIQRSYVCATCHLFLTFIFQMMKPLRYRCDILKCANIYKYQYPLYISRDVHAICVYINFGGIRIIQVFLNSCQIVNASESHQRVSIVLETHFLVMFTSNIFL